MVKFNLLKQFVNTFRHSEEVLTTEESSINNQAFSPTSQTNYARSVGILRFAQNDGDARKLGCKKAAFTMAEILLSLTIIGVVAAITLPSLTGNINERTWNTQRKALYARMSQAIALMGSLNGYGQYSGTWSADSVTVTTDTAAQTFVTEGLAKVLKINNICDNEHFSDCGINSLITNMNNSKIKFPKKISELNPMFVRTYSESGIVYLNSQANIDTIAAAFETKNGESLVVFYNPFCIDLKLNYYTGTSQANSWIAHSQIFSSMCANFLYDLNGKKGPNTIGKDIGFIAILYPTDSVVVAPLPIERDSNNLSGTANMTVDDAIRTCSSNGDDIRLPNIEELNALFYNAPLLNLSIYKIYWSASRLNEDYSWALSFPTGTQQATVNRAKFYTRCIKR